MGVQSFGLYQSPVSSTSNQYPVAKTSRWQSSYLRMREEGLLNFVSLICVPQGESGGCEPGLSFDLGETQLVGPLLPKQEGGIFQN